MVAWASTIIVAIEDPDKALLDRLKLQERARLAAPRAREIRPEPAYDPVADIYSPNFLTSRDANALRDLAVNSRPTTRGRVLPTR